MKKTAILLILVLVAATITLSGCIGTEEEGSAEGESQLTPEQEQDNLWLQKAREEKNPAHCENIQNEGIKEWCKRTAQR